MATKVNSGKDGKKKPPSAATNLIGENDHIQNMSWWLACCGSTTSNNNVRHTDTAGRIQLVEVRV